MNNQITPQLDVGSTTIRALSAYGPLLQSLSADNVIPMAMIQMESLGSAFVISGKYAAKVPDYLQRCSSVRLERLAMSIGWCKGDAASRMASSAGGQASAPLSLCLFSLYDAEAAGTILVELSQKILPMTVAISSVAQLVNVGKILKAKLEIWGFGNQLAQQVNRVYDAYDYLGLANPANFLAPISPESMVEILAKISRALTEEFTLLRVTGTFGLGHVLGLVLTMFPQDTLVTVSGIAIFEGTRKSILIELGDDGQSQFTVETTVHGSSQHKVELRFPIKIDDRPQNVPYSFAWNNWIADLLQLNFQEVGLSCPPSLLTACCNLLSQLPAIINTIPSYADDTGLYDAELPKAGILQFLQPDPLQIVYDCCQHLFGALPSSCQLDLKTAYFDLAAEAFEALRSVKCLCRLQEKDSPCKFSKRPDGEFLCSRLKLYDAIRAALEHALYCLLVDAAPDATVCRPVGPSPERYFLHNYMRRALGLDHTAEDSFSSSSLYKKIFHTFSSSNDSSIASNGASTIFPQVLRDLQWTPRSRFELMGGQLIFNERYYPAAKGAKGRGRPWARVYTPKSTDKTYPQNYGEHSSLTFTIEECPHYLEL